MKIWAKEALTAEGWRKSVRVDIDAEGRIVAVTPNVPAEGTEVGVLLPSPANLHSHAFQRAMAGMTERRGPDPRDSFWTWRQLMYRFLDHLTPDDVAAIAALVQVEMLEAGYASVGEFHYLHHQTDGTPYDAIAEMASAIIRAADQTGIGLTLLPVAYQVGGCDGRALGPGQVRFGNDPERYARLHEASRTHLAALPSDALIGVAPHSLRAVTPEGLKAAMEVAGDGPVHIHIAEQTAEVEELLAHRDARPVEWLMANAEVGPHWCLIHATHMTKEETFAVAESGAVAGLCPITECNLGDGIFNGVDFTRAGGRFGVGSDSNIRISLTEELRVLEYSQRLRDRSRAALAEDGGSTGRAVFEKAATGGAQAIRRPAGVIAPGLWADLTALDPDDLNLAGKSGDAILDAWIFAGDDRAVMDVWAAGRHMVVGGRHVAREAVEADYRRVMRGLEDRL